MRLALLAVPAFALAAAACSGSVSPDGVDDHHPAVLTLEGAEVTAQAGLPLEVPGGFERLGLLWDATDEGALEIRTSVDGATWSEWAAPTVVSVEEIAHAGHLDAAGAATRYEFRIPAGKAAPTFVVIEPLEEIPPPVDENAVGAEPEPDAPEDVVDIASVIRGTPIGNVRIYSRADWGARSPQCSSGAMTPARATIHHTVTPTNDSMSPQARLRQIQSFHMFSRGWCDIGYNYLISRDGRVWRGRGARTIGAHVANANTGNVGISFMGTYTSTAPTSTQMCQAAKLLRRLHEDFGGLSLNRTDVKGHRQLGSTSCPGNALYNRIDKILRKARGGCDVN